MARYVEPPKPYERVLGWCVLALGASLFAVGLHQAVGGWLSVGRWNGVIEVVLGLAGVLAGGLIALGGIAILRDVKRRRLAAA